MGIVTTTTCDQCSKTIGTDEGSFPDYAADGTAYVFCNSCHETRLTYANDQGLAYKDADIVVTFATGNSSAPIPGGATA